MHVKEASAFQNHSVRMGCVVSALHKHKREVSTAQLQRGQEPRPLVSGVQTKRARGSRRTEPTILQNSSPKDITQVPVAMVTAIIFTVGDVQEPRCEDAQLMAYWNKTRLLRAPPHTITRNFKTLLFLFL